jgi:hypothetical protein
LKVEVMNNTVKRLSYCSAARHAQLHASICDASHEGWVVMLNAKVAVSNHTQVRGTRSTELIRRRYL